MKYKTNQASLRWAFERFLLAKGRASNTLRLLSSMQGIAEIDPPYEQLRLLCQRMELGEPKLLGAPDRALLPLIAFHNELGWLLVVNQEPDGTWNSESPEGSFKVESGELAEKCAFVSLSLEVPISSVPSHGVGKLKGFQWHVTKTLLSYRGHLMESVAASIFIGLLTLITSLYSMQVYDRVIPTRSDNTLIVLTVGVCISILVELAMKYARSSVMDHIIVGLDNRLSREIFQRLLQLRVDQLPASVGSLAAQMRGYEQVRSFYTASTLFLLVDLPFGILFVVVIMLIGTPLVAAVPLVFAVIAFLLGISSRKQINACAKEGAAFSNLKTGLLVEAVEGVETIKAGSGGWKFLSRWMSVNARTIENDLKLRHSNDRVGYISATLQQISYVLMVCAGSIEIMHGHMTMGALIGCSILSGRILAPIMALPGLMVQHSHAKAASDGLEKIYELKTDNHGTDEMLIPDSIRGHFTLQEVQFSYGSGNPLMPSPSAIDIPRLNINAGEHVAIIGPIGSGKSTLLRLISGLYHPTKGKVLLDGLDISHISRDVVSRDVGYLQQEHRLFQGSLRENLLIGMPDPGDDALIEVMNRTGMIRFVNSHPLGLSRPIAEGGKGLSGGQKQLVAFTRVVLSNPSVLLLDEPTATMDEDQERVCLRVLAEEVAKGKTLVVVTHKPSLLSLVQRIIVVSGNRIVLDSPREEVLQKLNPRQEPAHAGSAN